MADQKLSRRSFLTISAMTAAACTLDWRRFTAMAARIGPKGDYPAVVIGAGLGGLTGAAYLAKAGFPVTVVEQHSIPGGYATSFDRAAGKFTFDVSLHGTAINNNGAARLLDEHVSGGAVKNALSALWGYYGLPPSKLSAFYYANATGGYLRNGSYYIRGSSQNLSNALAAVIEGNGGRVICDTAAERIIMANGAVAGVELSSGETLPARAVASNASALTTFKKLLPPAARPAGTIKRLEGCRPSISCFLVWLGLNRPVSDRVTAFSTHVSTGIGPDEDHALKCNGDVAKGAYGVAVYDNIYPDYSSPGTATVQLIYLCGYAPWRRFEADYKAGKKTAYNQEKQRWADILIHRAEQDVIPGLTGMIAVREAATPLTCQRYTGNPQGAIYGFEQSMDNAFMNRLGNRTPVKGLYLASAWGNPGGGYVGVMRGGQRAGQAIIEDFSA